MREKITAIIPARSGSRRLKDKNITMFDGLPLLIYKIRQLKSVSKIDDIVVSSDSDEYLRMAEKEGVLTHKREDRFCDEISEPFGEVVKNICEAVSGEHILWATCTSPLVFPQHYSEAIQTYFKVLGEYDSLISVEPFKRYVWNEEKPLNYELGIKHKPSQELEQLYFITDGIELAPREDMIKWKYFHGINPYKYVLPKVNCVDIDDEIDLYDALARLELCKKYQ